MDYSELHQNKISVSLYTTLPLARWDSFKIPVNSWRAFSFVDTTILCTQDDLNSYSDTVAHISSLGIDFRSYGDSSVPKSDRNGKPNRTPSLKSLFEVFNQGKRSSCYIYTNADIYLAPSHHAVLSDLLRYSIEHRKIIFASRWDVTTYGEPVPKLYDIGFDLFIVPESCLHKISQVDLSTFFIGQVGWDYALPLSLVRDDICKTSILPIEHLVHPTTSTQSWSSAMLNILTVIHQSHIHRSSFSLLSYKTIKSLLLVSKLLQRIMPSWLYRRLSPYLKYINSRLSFYGYIGIALSSLPEFNG